MPEERIVKQQSIVQGNQGFQNQQLEPNINNMQEIKLNNAKRQNEKQVPLKKEESVSYEPVSFNEHSFQFDNQSNEEVSSCQE